MACVVLAIRSIPTVLLVLVMTVLTRDVRFVRMSNNDAQRLRGTQMAEHARGRHRSFERKQQRYEQKQPGSRAFGHRIKG